MMKNFLEKKGSQKFYYKQDTDSATKAIQPTLFPAA